ncbi:BTB/POZ domain-containing protein SETH6 [Apostasia shenzhenica]|uniref:BTB/POZ domain-containing protein SETH6 n=1 Tax=Apostasia shenzhenica TaxID=1088818 RepID=A0A2I0ASD6_9ASPA|nr:BTB/POZ domain-containing protein SETH6 [Apostasia shenzhenica]
MGVVTFTELKHSVSGKKTLRPCLSVRHGNEWPLSEVASDLTVEVGEASFPLHKFPLVSRSGKIRKLLSENKESKITRINLDGIPGGPESFELAAKFCYGYAIDISLANVAMLRCTAHNLQMTEGFSENNLELRTELYLKDSVFPITSNSIAVLHRCENLLPVAEEINLVGRIISGIVSNVCREQLSSGLSKLDRSLSMAAGSDPSSEWWEEAMAVLSLEFFQRVLSAMKAKGLKQETLGRILVNYAQNSIREIESSSNRRFSDPEAQKKQRMMVEAVVSLLPTHSRKSPVPISFLSGLLKASVMVSASSVCRADLEKRIGLQLDQAILEDILIPSSSNGNGNHQMYDTESAARIFSVFSNLKQDDEERDGFYEYDSPKSPKQSLIFKFSKLMDSYLAEIALDSNLPASKFISLAELLPDHARSITDGLYRSVDIFLKVMLSVSFSH